MKKFALVLACVAILLVGCTAFVACNAEYVQISVKNIPEGLDLVSDVAGSRWSESHELKISKSNPKIYVELPKGYGLGDLEFVFTDGDENEIDFDGPTLLSKEDDYQGARYEIALKPSSWKELGTLTLTFEGALSAQSRVVDFNLHAIDELDSALAEKYRFSMKLNGAPVTFEKGVESEAQFTDLTPAEIGAYFPDGISAEYGAEVEMIAYFEGSTSGAVDISAEDMEQKREYSVIKSVANAGTLQMRLSFALETDYDRVTITLSANVAEENYSSVNWFPEASGNFDQQCQMYLRPEGEERWTGGVVGYMKLFDGEGNNITTFEALKSAATLDCGVEIAGADYGNVSDNEAFVNWLFEHNIKFDICGKKAGFVKKQIGGAQYAVFENVENPMAKGEWVNIYTFDAAFTDLKSLYDTGDFIAQPKDNGVEKITEFGTNGYGSGVGCPGGFSADLGQSYQNYVLKDAWLTFTYDMILPNLVRNTMTVQWTGGSQVVDLTQSGSAQPKAGVLVSWESSTDQDGATHVAIVIKFEKASMVGTEIGVK